VVDVGVVGATGYTGLELLRILSQHSQINRILITNSNNRNDKTLRIVESLRNKKKLTFVDYDSKKFGKCDVVFFCYTPWCGFEKS
jgi:N-acetyl-gamma-glutamyl-phosphate reductase